MRLWSVHPRYLDRQGLTACWREALLAQKVLSGATRGYRHHPQLDRFRAAPDPAAAVAAFLEGIADEAHRRGYRFDRARIAATPDPGLRLPVTDGQLALEWDHLRAKITVRSPEVAARWADVATPLPHPLFTVAPGPVAPWERAVVRGTGQAPSAAAR